MLIMCNNPLGIISKKNLKIWVLLEIKGLLEKALKGFIFLKKYPWGIIKRGFY